jgi:hypothetical protein
MEVNLLHRELKSDIGFIDRGKFKRLLKKVVKESNK